MLCCNAVTLIGVVWVLEGEGSFDVHREGMSSVFTTEILRVRNPAFWHYFGLLSKMLKMTTCCAEEMTLFRYMWIVSSSVKGTLSSYR